MPRNDTSIEPPKMTGFRERWVAEHIYMLGGGGSSVPPPHPTPHPDRLFHLAVHLPCF